MDTHSKQLLAAHIEAMNKLTASIAELVQSVALLVDAGTVDDEPEEEQPTLTLLNGKHLS